MQRAHPRTVPRGCRTVPHADVARGTAMSLTMLSPETCVRPLPRLPPAGPIASHGLHEHKHRALFFLRKPHVERLSRSRTLNQQSRVFTHEPPPQKSSSGKKNK